MGNREAKDYAQTFHGSRGVTNAQVQLRAS
jgi:hypothetical protein